MDIQHNYSLRTETDPSIFQWAETWYNGKRGDCTMRHKTIEEFEMFNQNVVARLLNNVHFFVASLLFIAK